MLSARQLLHTAIWVKRHLRSELVVPELEVLRRYLRPADCVVDVGAHGGSWSVPLSRLVPQGKVFAFDALPYYADMLRSTLRLLNCRNVEVTGRPVLESERDVEFVWRDPSGRRLKATSHIRGAGEQAADNVLRIRGVTLDSALMAVKDRIRFIKLDIEGAELSALRGAEEVLEISRPLLYLELSDLYCRRYGHSAEDLLNFLRRRGYAALLSDDGAWRDAAPEAGGSHDVWFVPEDQRDAFLQQQQAAPPAAAGG
jgi:FkbM family methyltransferase